MTEVYADIAKTTLYYGTEDSSRLGAHFTFNFQLINKVDSDSNARDLVNAIDEWNDYLPLQYTSNWVVSNKYTTLTITLNSINQFKDWES